MTDELKTGSAPPFSSQLGGAEFTEIGFSYREINVTFNSGGTTASDVWEAPI
jgi:hypothetical protein